VYERGRASYPSGVVDAIGATPDTRIADIGCGTGKFTRLIAHARTIGVEPLDGMRAMFHELLPDVPIVAGVAEALPLRDHSIDIASFASAFHWVDHGRALPELHRVLRPHGTLAVVWNRRDDLTGWAADFWEITEAHRGDTPGYRTGAWRTALETSPYFGPITERWFEHTQRVDIDGAIARVASISFIETNPKRDEILDDARAFLEALDTDVIELPYRTVVYVCENLADA
jgi:SAM-dependent methyltransferase